MIHKTITWISLARLFARTLEDLLEANAFRLWALLQSVCGRSSQPPSVTPEIELKAFLYVDVSMRTPPLDKMFVPHKERDVHVPPPLCNVCKV